MPFLWRCRRKYFNWSCFNFGQTGCLWSEVKSTNMGGKGNNMDVRDACASCQVNFISLSLRLCRKKRFFVTFIWAIFTYIHERAQWTGNEYCPKCLAHKPERHLIIFFAFNLWFYFVTVFTLNCSSVLLVLCIILHSYSYSVKELLRAIHTNSLTRHPQSGYPKELFATRWGFWEYFVNLQHHVNSEHRIKLWNKVDLKTCILCLYIKNISTERP